MKIIGPDKLIFGVEDVENCKQFALDYGLQAQDEINYVALDGTGIEIRAKDDPSLPAPLASGAMIRKTIYGVADQVSLDEINAELSKDRQVKVLEDGSLEAVDDLGFVLGFQLTIRKPLNLAAEKVNAPGDINRGINQVGVNKEGSPDVRSLSHVVYFVPDSVKAEAFYNRIGFKTTDRFTGVGPFMRPAGTEDHHTLFFIQTPPHMQGCEHFTFHMGGPTDVVRAGTNMVNKGYQSFWGPGRHIYGSNWFWYFKSPFGCNMEYDADMDQHDDVWQERESIIGADNSQAFLLQYREKWAPAGGPPPKA
ncbi:VOC family protein [Shewanella sp. UCD-KL21]|uniref:VOC family protein n=1 Tax=Shewanella sp. UCD-KL21 TaxID=1917164 RepID=UPI000970E717|nr:VOC family protein [Shewanella sp. UCD-KL21]